MGSNMVQTTTTTSNATPKSLTGNGMLNNMTSNIEHLAHEIEVLELQLKIAKLKLELAKLNEKQPHIIWLDPNFTPVFPKSNSPIL